MSSNKHLRLSGVSEKTGLSKMTIWRYLNDDAYAHVNFPRPRYIGGRIPLFPEVEVDAWLASLPTRKSA